MENTIINFSPIGIIHGPFNTLEEMPIQPTAAASADGYAEIFEQYLDGLKDLEGFSHVILLYFFHKVNRVDLTVTPFLDREPRGVFSIRAPTRPNPIGISIVKIRGIEREEIFLESIDILDGTPLLDIKPYVPDFDQQSDVKIGWLSTARSYFKDQKSDKRFQ